MNEENKSGGLHLALSPLQSPGLAPAPVHSATASVPAPYADDTAAIDFGSLWHGLRRFWWVGLLIAGLFTGAGFYYTKKATKLYTATGVVQLDQERTSLLPGAGGKGEDLRSLEILMTTRLSLVSNSVLLRIAQNFDLANDPVLTKGAPGPLADDVIVWMLASRITAEMADRGSRLITINVDDTDPARAQAICQEVIDMALTRTGEANAGSRGKTLTALEKEAEKVRKQRDETQAKITAFRARFPDLPLEERPSEMKTNPLEDRIKALELERVKAEEDAASALAVAQRIRAAGANTNGLLAIPGLGTQESIVTARSLLTQAQATLAGSDFGPRHPASKDMARQIKELETGLLTALINAANVEISKAKKGQENVARVNAAIKSAREQQNAFSGVAAEFSGLAAQLKADNIALDALLAQQSAEQANASYAASPLTVVSEPLLPTNAAKPRKSIIMMGAAALGGMAGLASILILMLLDGKVRSPNATERLLHLPALAVLPADKIPDAQHTLVYGRPGAEAPAEAFRSLRTALSIFGRGAAARSFLFTSPGNGEGKSYTAVNFATSFARQGYRTLLIDANLRQPVLDTILTGSRRESGLADHLMGLTAPGSQSCVAVDSIPNLFLFSAGTPRAHPGEILNEQAFARLISDSLNWFHRVIIDTPSVGTCPDALPLARHVDAVALVLKAGVTTKKSARRAAAQLAAAGARPAGFILNAAPRRAMEEGFSSGTFAASFTAPPSLPALPPARA